MTQKTVSGEIDLMELLAKGYRAVKANLLVFIILPLAGLVLMFSLSFRSGNKYASSMMITTNLLSENEAKFIFEELGRADSIPGLSEEESKKLVSLKFEVEKGLSIGTNDPKLASNGQMVYLKIIANVTDPSVFPAIEKKLIAYLNNVGPVMQNRKNLEIFYKSVIQKIDHEIAAMDQIKSSDKNALANYVDPANLFAKTVELYKERVDNEVKLKNIESVQVAKGFGSLIKDSKMPKVIVAMVGLLMGLALATFLMFVRYFNSYNRSLNLD
jgi:hypothetical protein